MAQWDIAEPQASALIESLRAFGYTPETALADLVDNSVSAGATCIDVRFHWNGRRSFVALIDDGHGMTDTELVNAMRPGSVSPLDDRPQKDLGRFGLGLKTASFSQARELTVRTKTIRQDQIHTRRWDLDTVEEFNQWRLLRDAPTNLDLPDLGAPSGTVVVWSKCDRLVGDADTDDRRAQDRFNATVDKVATHLSVVFHRFLTGPSKLTMRLNGRPLKPRDPFLENHVATQCLGTETLGVHGQTIEVTPYVLPHRDKLTEEQKEVGAGTAGWNQLQGFYLYRGNRLLVEGSWLSLGFAKDEHTKLARIRIDIPTTMDHLWQVDVKKSSARAPGPLHTDLKRIAKNTRRKAEEVYRFRGKATSRKRSADHVHSWQQIKIRDGVKYRINRKHPVLLQLLNKPKPIRDEFEKALRLIEETIPIPLIGLALAKSIDEPEHPFAHDASEVETMLRVLIQQTLDRGEPLDAAIERFASAEPFVDHPHIVQAVTEEFK